MSWDVALTPHRTTSAKYETLNLRLPSALSRAMKDEGFNRAKIEVTRDGILVRPYVASDRRTGQAVDLPGTWNGGA